MNNNLYLVLDVLIEYDIPDHFCLKKEPLRSVDKNSRPIPSHSLKKKIELLNVGREKEGKRYIDSNLGTGQSK